MSKFTVEDVQVLRLELEDATEDMNDALREWETLMRARGYGSGMVGIEPYTVRRGGAERTVSTDRLHWSGKRLVYEASSGSTSVLNASRRMRIRALKAMPALYTVLTS